MIWLNELGSQLKGCEFGSRSFRRLHGNEVKDMMPGVARWIVKLQILYNRRCKGWEIEETHFENRRVGSLFACFQPVFDFNTLLARRILEYWIIFALLRQMSICRLIFDLDNSHFFVDRILRIDLIFVFCQWHGDDPLLKISLFIFFKTKNEVIFLVC